MKKRIKSLAIVAAVAMLAACGSLTEQDRMRLPTQYATMKVIEQSDDITAEGVLRYTELARMIVARDVQINAQSLVQEILEALDAEKLSPSDRFLVVSLVQQIEIEAQSLNLIQPDTRLSLLEVIDWIEQAARMAQ